jgi:branched-chain amino acid transport system substrate-binding protein
MVMERHLTFISLFGNDVNSNFHYQNYFSMNPVGGETPRNALSQGFFAVAEMMNPRPQTVALVGADAEFGKNALEGARANAKQAGLQIVYDQTYPPATTDYSPIVRSIQGTNPDLVFVGAYPPDSVGIVRAANEIGLRAKMFGGSMVGLWSTAIKMQLGPLLNGIVNFETWQPVKSLATPEALAFLEKYQARAVAAGVDPLGYSVPPFAYSRMQVLGQAIEGVGSLDQAKLTDYLRNHTFDTVAGGITFGPNGEWTEPRVLAVQFQGVAGHDLDQFKDPKTEVVLWPPALQTGSLSYPYTEVKR